MAPRKTGLSRRAFVKDTGGLLIGFSLVDAGLLQHKAYGSIGISDEGKRLALSILRRNSCLSRFFIDLLRMDPETARAEVCRLEHMISDEVLSRMEVLVAHADASEAFRKSLEEKLAGLKTDAPGKTEDKIGSFRPHT